MGKVKRWWMEKQENAYEEAQSRLRLSMTARANVRPMAYPLEARIVELAFTSKTRSNKGYHRSTSTCWY